MKCFTTDLIGYKKGLVPKPLKTKNGTYPAIFPCSKTRIFLANNIIEDPIIDDIDLIKTVKGIDLLIPAAFKDSLLSFIIAETPSVFPSHIFTKCSFYEVGKKKGFNVTLTDSLDEPGTSQEYLNGVRLVFAERMKTNIGIQQDNIPYFAFGIMMQPSKSVFYIANGFLHRMSWDGVNLSFESVERKPLFKKKEVPNWPY